MYTRALFASKCSLTAQAIATPFNVKKKKERTEKGGRRTKREEITICVRT
jgi:hypothetical protein